MLHGGWAAERRVATATEVVTAARATLAGARAVDADPILAAAAARAPAAIATADAPLAARCAAAFPAPVAMVPLCRLAFAWRMQRNGGGQNCDSKPGEKPATRIAGDSGPQYVSEAVGVHGGDSRRASTAVHNDARAA